MASSSRCHRLPRTPTARAKLGVEAFQHQRPPGDGEEDQRGARRARHQQQRRVVHAEHAAEQQLRQLHRRAAPGDDGDARRQRREVEPGQRRILPPTGAARDGPGAERDHQPRRQPAEREPRRPQPAEHEGQRHPWQDAVRQRVTGQAHPPQHQEDAQRRGGQAQRQAADQGAAQEAELGEGGEQPVP
jgi:hypothetical protein